jgi:hypothetical protein
MPLAMVRHQPIRTRSSAPCRRFLPWTSWRSTPECCDRIESECQYIAACAAQPLSLLRVAACPACRIRAAATGEARFLLSQQARMYRKPHRQQVPIAVEVAPEGYRLRGCHNVLAIRKPTPLARALLV